MKAVFKSKAHTIQRDYGTGFVSLRLELASDVAVVEGAPSKDAKAAGGHVTINLKPLVADALLVGQELYVTVSTEKPADASKPSE